ncbi:hypothetical protein AAC387_Pa07g2341 [Persea americana]
MNLLSRSPEHILFRKQKNPRNEKKPSFCSQKPQEAATKRHCLFPEEGVSRKGKRFVDDKDNERERECRT